jgi:hypothetical protein
MNDVIERTNKFFIEMSRKVLSEKEYDVLQKLLIKKMTLQQAANSYGYTIENIQQIYEDAYQKVKSTTELMDEIDIYEQKLQQLQQDFDNETNKINHIKKEYKPIDIRLNKKLSECHFPFTPTLHSILDFLEVHTIGQLAEIPLDYFQKFRGFGNQRKKELAKFIEIENIVDLFKDFSAWKERPIVYQR